ncbi:hypothetical protein [Sulfuriroseicoccus oceanibius]|uniref:Uncharacterized protein n=1 Tax=Sulfuriroseicoccus oceanibius TaxID=2707525 RepID=A0A6B3L7Q0_9BACT|nr:hypothetical protein [Sulfuriroseicoccus oceanibius]QQL44237.1 hypothetical protein G3M56_010060 [Sulfuriroseicoccus oceanibius]
MPITDPLAPEITVPLSCAGDVAVFDHPIEHIEPEPDREQIQADPAEVLHAMIRAVAQIDLDAVETITPDDVVKIQRRFIALLYVVRPDVIRGATVRDIAAALGISFQPFHRHVRKVSKATGLHYRTEKTSGNYRTAATAAHKRKRAGKP